MKDSYIRKCWFCIVTIFILFLSVIFVEVYKALGTTIVLDSLDTGSTEYKVTNYSKYSVIEITEGGEYTLTQNDLDTVVNANIIVDSDEEVTLILDGINVKAGNYSQTSVFSSAVYGTAAISVQGDTDCKIVLKDDSVNTLTGYTEYGNYDEPVNNSFYHTAAISVENTIIKDEIRLASLTIEGENGAASTGILNANGGNQSAAIGAGINRLSGNITINSGIINAVSGDYGAAIGDGDTVQVGGSRYDEENGSFVWVVGETNSVATIEVNGGELWATATKDTPGIGTADNLISGYHAEVDIWTGLQITINGGVVVAIGGVQAYNPSSAIGPGSNTFVSSNNIVINKGEGDVPTEIIAVTRTDSGSYPVSNSGGDAIPVLSADSTASVLNVKFSEPKIARQLDFWYYVDPTYKTDATNDFPNALLDRMGDIEVLGLAVLLPEGKYKISQDIDNDGADEDDPTLDEGLVVGGTGSITCDENYYGSVSCRYPLEIRSPSHLTVTHGDSAYFDVEVLQYSQGASLSYQWYVSTDAGSSWNLLYGANSERYDISEALISDSGNLYRCDVTENYYGENVVLSSLPAKLTVLREIEYEVDVNLLLDGSLYRDNNSSFELYDTNGTYIKDLELVDGVLNFAVTANTYRIYIDGEDVGIEFVIDADNTLYNINYYSVNLDVVSDNADDSVLINGTSYNSGNYSKALVLLSGNNINLSALAVGESEVSKFTINSSNVVIDNLVSGYDVSVNSKTDIVVEFDYKKYDIDINVNLDNSVYTDVTGTFELKNDSTYSLNNTNGVLEGSVPAGTYVLYRDGEAIKDDIVITSSNLSSSVDYYSVNLDVASPNNSNTVLINENTYNNSVSKALIVLDGDIIMVEAHPASEMEVVKYTVNNVNDSIDDVLNYDAIVVNNTVNLYIEFDVIEYPINITAYLDSSVYTSISGVFELKDSDGNKITDLTNTSGILNGNVAAGNYVLYRDGKLINDSINVSSTNKEFRVDYYSVNLDIISSNNTDTVIINGNTFVNGNESKIILFKGESVSINAVPASEMEIVDFKINDVSSNIDDLLSGLDINISDTMNIVVEFDAIEYSINVTTYLDNSPYEEVEGTFELYSGSNKIIDLANNNGILSGNVPAGIYDIYVDSEKSLVTIDVSSTKKEFRLDYYTVNLDIENSYSNNSVIINGNIYTNDSNAEIVLLAGKKVNVKAQPADEIEVIKYTVNNVEDNINDLLSGDSVLVDKTTNLYVEFNVVKYPVEIVARLDGNSYDNVTGNFALYSLDGNKVIDLVNASGVLSGNVPSGNYKLYIDGNDENININVSSTNRNFVFDYYSVNLELVSSNNNDLVSFNEVSYSSNKDLAAIVLSGKSVTVKAIPDNEMEVISYTINGINGNISELLNTDTIVVNEKTNLYVEFDVVEYPINITAYLDSSVYTTINGVFELKDSDGNKVTDLTNNSGVLSTDVPAGNFVLYRDGKVINDSVNVSSTNKEFRVDYYSVNLDIISSNNTDTVIINGNTFVNGNESKIILFKGESVSINAVPASEMEIVDFKINDVSSNIDDLLLGLDFNISDTMNLVVEFDVVEYSITVNTYLDDKVYSNIDGVFELRDNSGNVIKTLTNTSGILSTDVPAGNYKLYRDNILINDSINVSSTNKEFRVDYYNVNLKLESPNNKNYVIIDGINYYDNTADNQIVLLKNSEVYIMGVSYDEMEITKYTINEKDSVIEELINGVKVKVNDTKDIFIEFSIIEYPIKVNVYLDKEIYDNISGKFALYSGDTKVKELTNTNGVLSTDIPAGDYILYRDDKVIDNSIIVSDTNKEFRIDYYNVNLELVSSNDLDSVVINDSTYVNNTKDQDIVLLAGESISVKAIPSSEMEVIKYTVNSVNDSISDLLSTDTIVVNETINLYVEFDVIEYSIKITNYLDNVVYSNLDGEFSLYKDNSKVKDLTNNSGVLSTNVPAGSYRVYNGDDDLNIDIVVSSSNKEFRVDYYTVNLELVSPNNKNVVKINDVEYTKSTSNNEIIVLSGTEVSLKAVPYNEMEITVFNINGVASDISELVKGYKINVNETKNIYVGFGIIAYNIKVTAYLDNEVYTNISGSFALYDQDNKLVSNLVNNKGVLTGALEAGIYYLYRDGNNTNVKVEVTSSDKEFRFDYYTVNLELVSPNNQDSVILEDNTYLDSVNNEIVLLSGDSISIKALPVSEMEVIKYTINEEDSNIEKLLGGYELSIKETTNIYVEFDIITYDIKITNYLDNKVYTNIPGDFALYSDSNKIINLTKKDGVLSGNIVAGNYSLYKGETNLGISINVTSSNKEFRVDYYTVNLELVSPNDGDSVIIGDNTYVDSMNGEIVLLSGDSISIKALPVSEMEVIKYTINDEDSDISKLLEGYNISVTEQTNIYVEFDIITYDISVTTYLDNSVYESIVGIFELRDSKGNKVSDLTNTNGVLKANIAAGSYNIYIDGEDIGESIEVTSSNKDFRIDYYTVNLELVSPNSEDYVEINGACFKDSTTLNEIILLAGNDISLKGVPYEEMEVTKFTINEADSNINDLLNGYTIKINTKTNIYVRFGVIAYGIKINTYLDDSEYLDNSRIYSLYDNDGNLVDDMLNTGGVLTSDTEAGNYYLYENGTNTNIKIDVTSDNKEFKVDYYTVNLELVSSNENDSVIIGDNTYVDSMSREIILLSGESINVKGVPDTEQEIIKYSINSNNGDINKLLGGTSIKVLEKTDIYVEFDIIEYPIKINVYLDDAKYNDVSHDYSLYKDGTLFKELNNNDGILNTDVPAGSYTIYEDEHSTSKNIVVTRNDKVFNLNYYTVNLEVVSPNDNDYVKINGISYVDGTNEREIVVLEGDTISIEAVPYNEMEVKEYLVNEKDNEIADLLAGYNITIEEKTNIYVEFEIIEYPIKINTFLDGNSYDNLEGIFKLYDENGNKVSNLTKTNGVLTASLAAGTYYVYDEGVNTNYSIVVTDNDREFNMYYYTVNLVIDSKNDLNSVVIDDVTYYDKTKDNEIVVLYGDSVNVKALVGEEMEIYEYTINNNSSDISSLMSGYDLKINNTTNLYVKFDDYRYTSVFNVYIDDEVIEDLSLVPEISFVRDNIQYTKDSKFTNGLYEVILDGVSSDISINVNKGIVDVYFYNVSLVGDRGINATNGSGLYLKDTDVSIEASLNAGFNFEGWYLGEELLDNGLSYNIRNISKKHDLTAKTVALAPYEPVVTPVNGYYDYGSLDTKVIELDVTPYEGTSIVSYQWYKCDELECNNKNLINGANSDIFNPEDVNVDLYGYYCEVVILREDNGETLTTGSVVRLGIDPITPEISLEEKVEYFTGSEINIDDVLISNIVEADEFDVEYLYYLDEECTVLTNKANSGANIDGGAPVNVGSYYVKVTVSGNSNYNEVSSVSKVTILEAVLPPVEEEEDEKNPVTLDNIILVVVASILGIVLAIRCLPFVFKY